MHSLRDTEKSLFKLRNSELWRPAIPDPVVGSRSVKKSFEILFMSTTYPKLIALRFSLTLITAWKKSGQGGNLHLALRPFGAPVGPRELIAGPCLRVPPRGPFTRGYEPSGALVSGTSLRTPSHQHPFSFPYFA